MMTEKQRTSILITMMIGTFTTAMAVTVTNTMLPAVIADLGVDTMTAQWLTSGSTLVSGIMIPAAAYLMKRIRSKTYFIAAICFFCCGSAIALTAQQFPLLLFGRLVQASGCGLLLPFSQVVLLNIYPADRYGMVMGIFAMGSTMAPVVAPTVAGFIIDSLGWHAVFAMLLIIGLIVLVLGFLFMKNVTETQWQRAPIVDIVLSTVGFSGLLIGLGNVASAPFWSLQTAGALILGAVAVTAFVIYELRSPEPLLNVRVFTYAPFRNAVIISMLMYVVCMGSGTILPIFSQSVAGYSVTAYALSTLPGSLFMVVTSIWGGRIYDKLGSRPLFIGGGTCYLAAAVVGMLFRVDASLWQIGILFGLISAGTGLLSTPATTMGIGDFTGSNRVDGSSILNTLRQIASSFSATFAVLCQTLFSRAYGSDVTGTDATYFVYIFVSVAILTVSLAAVRAGRQQPQPGPAD